MGFSTTNGGDTNGLKAGMVPKVDCASDCLKYCPVDKDYMPFFHKKRCPSSIANPGNSKTIKLHAGTRGTIDVKVPSYPGESLFGRGLPRKWIVKKKKLSKEEKAMAKLKAKMGKYKKGSKEHKAALKKMAALKKKMAAKVKAAKKAGKKAGKKGKNAAKKLAKKEKKKLSKEEKAMAKLKAKMGKFKKGSKEHKAAL